MSLDNFSDIVDSATTAASNVVSSVGDTISSAASGVSNFLSSGPASALSSIGSAISGALNSLGTLINPMPGVKLPIPNPLFNYATYDYVLGIAALSTEELNSASYMNNPNLTLLCKSANADPSNRIPTVFGQFDYFIEKLEIVTTMGLENGHSTNVFSLSFNIVEPYSMGTFFMTMQEAARLKGKPNYIDAPFLLTMDFRGNTETGRMDNIPGTARKIPFKFIEMDMTVTEAGAVYKCKAAPLSSIAHSSHTSAIKTDASVKGITVQEILQTGEKSLQTVLNKRLQKLKTDGVLDTPDKILILFPVDVSSGPGSAGSNNSENDKGATISVFSGTEEAIMQQLNLSKSQGDDPSMNTYIQDPANVNAIGKSKMGFSNTRQGDAPVGKDSEVVVDGNIRRDKNNVDQQVGDMRFSQDTDIPTAISSVLLNSEYVTKQLHTESVDENGVRKWFRIDTQVYEVQTDANMTTTGQHPRIIVYRILPYGVHSSAVTQANQKAPGFNNLSKNVVKQYDYLYTGKNVDILSFNIEVNTSFAQAAMATSPKRTQDNKQQATASSADDNKSENLQPLTAGSPPSSKPGVWPQSVRYALTVAPLDNQGGGGLETEATRAAKQFHDAITSKASMVQMNLKIIGDPFWIAQSGTGNYTSKPTQIPNLNSDGSVNYQTHEVYLQINFRTPVDINQTTGLYDFGKSTQSAPVLSWSGIYKVTNVTHHFEGGKFEQTLECTRMNGQEIPGAGSASNTLSVDKETKDIKKDDE